MLLNQSNSFLLNLKINLSVFVNLNKYGDEQYIALVKKNFYFLILVTCVSCNIIKKSSYHQDAKYSPLRLQEDFSTLYKVLKSNHPALYWYSSYDSINNSFADTYTSLHDSLTEEQFRKKVAGFISKLHCGHTTVRPSKAYVKYRSKQKTTLFPLYLKVWQDSAIVINNLVKGDPDVKRGTPVVAINGVPLKKIVDSMCHLISSDGYSNIFKYQVISFNFPGYYKCAYGIDSNYAIEYIDSSGRQKVKTYKNFDGKINFSYIKQRFLPGEFSRKKLRQFNLSNERNLEIESSLKTAVISVNTFSKGRLIHFFRKSLKKIKNQNIDNVILDLRLNSGGSVMACTKLTQYLIDKPFHVADTVVANNRGFHYKKYIKPWIIYWLSMHLLGRRYKDNKIHFRYFENHYFKPKNKNHFGGNIYVLTGGYTFSAATIVAMKLKGQANVTIVGEETGGGAYGNSAMLLTTIVLPNTKVRITLPLYKMVLNTNVLKNGRGVLPDVEVKPSSEFIKNNADAKMEKVLEILKTKK